MVSLLQQPRHLISTTRQINDYLDHVAALMEEKDQAIGVEQQELVQLRAAYTSVSAALAERDRMLADCNAEIEALTDAYMRTSSPEEREARMRRGESRDTEGVVRGAGIGQAGDALLEASRELNDVARNLREVASGNNISYKKCEALAESEGSQVALALRRAAPSTS